MKFAALFVLALLSGCATIVSGTHQKVAIDSVPSGATVTIDGAVRGATPLTVKLSRRPSHTLQLAKAGFESQTCTINSGFNGWFLANIAIGGVIGMAIDGLDGASSKLEVPSNGHFVLTPVPQPVASAQ